MAHKYEGWRAFMIDKKISTGGVQGGRMVEDPSGKLYARWGSMTTWEQIAGIAVSYSRELTAEHAQEYFDDYDKNRAKSLEELKKEVQQQCAAALNSMHNGEVIDSAKYLVDAISKYNREVKKGVN